MGELLVGGWRRGSRLQGAPIGFRMFGRLCCHCGERRQIPRKSCRSTWEKSENEAGDSGGFDKESRPQQKKGTRAMENAAAAGCVRSLPLLVWVVLSGSLAGSVSGVHLLIHPHSACIPTLFSACDSLESWLLDVTTLILVGSGKIFIGCA